MYLVYIIDINYFIFKVGVTIVEKDFCDKIPFFFCKKFLSYILFLILEGIDPPSGTIWVQV